MLAHRLVVGDRLGEHQRARADRVPDTGHQVGRCDGAVVSGPLAGGPLRQVRVVHGRGPLRPRPDRALVKAAPLGQPGRHLPQGEAEVGPGVPGGGHVPQRHLLLDRVDVQHVDAGTGGRPVGGGDPGHVAAHHQHHVGLRQQRVLAGGVPLVSPVQRVIGREVHPHRHRLDDGHGGQLTQPDQVGHGGRVAPQVRGDHQGGGGLLERGRDLVGHLRGECGRRDRAPPWALGRLRRQPLLHDLPGGGQVDRAGRFAAGDLQRPVHDLLRVAPGPDLVFILNVTADDPPLVGRVLNPVDEFVPAAGQLALLGHR